MLKYDFFLFTLYHILDILQQNNSVFYDKKRCFLKRIFPAKHSREALNKSARASLKIHPLRLMPGQRAGGDLDKVPGVLGDEFVLAVAGVEMPVIFVVGQGVEAALALVE